MPSTETSRNHHPEKAAPQPLRADKPRAHDGACPVSRLLKEIAREKNTCDNPGHNLRDAVGFYLSRHLRILLFG
jgi:hypothetical protein